MPQKLNSSIFLLDTIFHTIMTSSSKTLNSNLHLSSIFSMFLFIVNYLGKKASKRLGVLSRDAERVSIYIDINIFFDSIEKISMIFLNPIYRYFILSIEPTIFFFNS